MGVIRGQIHVLIIGPLMCSCMSRSRGGGVVVVVMITFDGRVTGELCIGHRPSEH